MPSSARHRGDDDTGRRADAHSVVTPGVRVASEWAWRLGAIALGLYALSRLFAEFAHILVPVMVALLLTGLLHPVADWLGARMPRGAAALITLLGTLLLIVGLFTLVGQQAGNGFPELRSQASDGFGQVRTWLAEGPLHLQTDSLSGYLAQANDAVAANRDTVASGALGVASTATRLATGFFITLFATFFFLYAGHRIWAWLLRMFPGAAQGPLDRAGRSGWVTLSHYVRATVVVAAVDGLGVGIGTAVLGVPLALPLGVAVFLGAFVPVVGALVTGLLAILVALVAQGPVIALVVLGLVVFVNQLEAHVLQPFLLGRAVDVHPLAVILAIAAGVELAGIVGALFAVPVAAVANTMISSLVNPGRDDPGERIAEEDAPLAPDEPPVTDTEEVPDLQRDAVTGDRVDD